MTHWRADRTPKRSAMTQAILDAMSDDDCNAWVDAQLADPNAPHKGNSVDWSLVRRGSVRAAGVVPHCDVRLGNR